MTTVTILPSTALDPKAGYGQLPQDAVDLDGFTELGFYVRVDNYDTSGSTLDVVLSHGARTGDTDRLPLATISLTSGGGTYHHQGDFLRYVSVKAVWQDDTNVNNAGILEVLAVPKK